MQQSADLTRNHPITGKRTQVYKSGFRSKKEALLAKAASKLFQTAMDWEGLISTSPKTTNSTREIVISSSLVELLKKLKNEQDEMKRRMGPLYGKYNLVISTDDGKPTLLRFCRHLRE